MQLFDGVFRDESLGGELEEDVLSALGHVGGGGPTKVVEADVEPLVHVAVDGVVLVANLFGTETCIRKAGSIQSFG